MIAEQGWAGQTDQKFSGRGTKIWGDCDVVINEEDNIPCVSVFVGEKFSCHAELRSRSVMINHNLGVASPFRDRLKAVQMDDQKVDLRQDRVDCL